MSLSTRQTRTAFAQPEDWESQKDKIRYLYYELGKPLREVVEIMRTKHDFNATPKMYKWRFRRWGFRKNLRANELRQLQFRASTEKQFRLPMLHGREIGPRRLRRLMPSHMCSQAELPPSIKAPDDLFSSENVLHRAMVYSNSQCDHGIWETFGFDPVRSKSCIWYHNMLLTVTRGREKSDLVSTLPLIDRYCDQYSALLRTPDPLVLWLTYLAFMDLALIGQDVALSFGKYVVELCATALGCVHPLTVLLTSTIRTGSVNPTMCNKIVMVVEAQFDILVSRSKPGDQFWLLYMRIMRIMLRRLGDIDLDASEEVASRSDAVTQWLSHNPYLKNEEMLNWTRTYISMVHIARKELAPGAPIFNEIEQHNEKLATTNVPISVSIPELQTNLDETLGRHASPENFYKLAIALVLPSKSAETQMQIRLAFVYTALEGLNRQRGNELAARAAQQECMIIMDTIWNRSEKM
ncbi:hypothetical protein AB5N19_01244 [Seiridium cardinale]